MLLEAIAYQDHSENPIHWMIELEVLDLLYSFIINKNDVAECLLLLTSIVNESEHAKEVYKHPLCEVCVGLVSSDDLRVKKEAAILLSSLMTKTGETDPKLLSLLLTTSVNLASLDLFNFVTELVTKLCHEGCS